MTTQETTRQTTTTTTTDRPYFWERRPAGALPWVIGGLGLLGLGLAHDLPVRYGIEDNLTTRAEAVIAETGASGAQITFVGRDGTLTGSLPPGVDAQAVVSKIKALDGVRMVNVDLGGSASGTGATPSVGASTSVEASPASPSADTSPSVAATSGASPPAVTAVSKDGKLTLTGTVPSQEAMAALVASAADVFGADGVVNQLTVDEGVSAAGLTEFGSLVAALGTGSSATAALEAGQVTMSGSVPDAAAKQAADAAAQAVTGGDAGKVTSQLTVGAGAPSAAQGAGGAQAELNALPQITFGTGSTRLTPAGLRAVQQAAAILKANPAVKVRIEGHTDDIGDAAANLRLSTARAESVRRTLHDMGIAHDRMSYIGYGESRPKVANTSDANRAKNRRVQFVVL